PSNISGLNSNTGSNGHIVKITLAVVAVKHIGVVGEVGLEDVEICVEIIIAHRNAHACLLDTVFAQGHSAFQCLLPESAIGLVDEEPTRSRITCDINVGPAIIVIIGSDHGHRVGAGCSRNTGRLADFGKCTVTIIVKELNEAGGQATWPAVDGNTLPGAIR